MIKVMRGGGIVSDAPTKWHHPNCSFGATNGPAGDICNCNMVVSYPAYAALRATITQQAQELERVKNILTYVADCHPDGKKYLYEAKALGTDYCDEQRQERESLRQQLTAAQARCAKFEAIVRDHQNGACNRTIAQLQAALTAREAHRKEGA